MKNYVVLIALLMMLVFPSTSSALLSKTNFCYGTLGSTVASAATTGSTFTFTPGTNAGACPTTSFKIVLFSAACSSPSSCATREIMTVTRSATTFTIVSREDESTTKPASWVVGTKVFHDLTAATLTEGLTTVGFNNVTAGTNAGGNLICGTGCSIYATGTGTITATNLVPGGSDYNLFVGENAGVNITSGLNDTFIGGYAGDANTTGSNNTGIGTNALGSVTTGGSNTAVGSAALSSTSTGSYSVAIGGNALLSQVGSSDMSNVGIGYSAAYKTTTGTSNIAVGRDALYNNAVGTSSIAIGTSSLYNATVGRSTGVGYMSLFDMTTGYYNVALGEGAGRGTTTGTANVYLGHYAGYTRTTSSYANNTMVGYESGAPTSGVWTGSIGSNNTYLGYHSGYTATGSSNVFIGYQAGTGETASNKLYISNSNTSTPIIYGDFSEGTVGAVRFRHAEIDKTTSATLTVLEMSDTIITNYGTTDAANLVLTLPDIDGYQGIQFKVHAATDMTTYDFCLKAATDNKFYLGGVAGGDNGCICLPHADFDVGDQLDCYTATNGAGVTDIFCTATVGAWAAVADNTGSCPN